MIAKLGTKVARAYRIKMKIKITANPAPAKIADGSDSYPYVES